MAEMRRGLALRAYLAASHLIPLLAPTVLRRRMARGKEDPVRWREKLGQNLPDRPDGPLIWLHAVGLGEVLSLRGLIAAMSAARPDLSFLVTSTTAASAQVFAKNVPARTQHAFLPLDAPAYRRRFLDRFRPDLCLWAEQDLWPGLVSDLAARGIPQAIVAARMNAVSFAKHSKAKSLYADLYGAMARITAQDAATADHLTALGAADVAVTGSLKPAAPPLAHDAAELARLQKHLQGRFIWTTAPAHEADIAIARAAHQALRQSDPSALLVIAPRYPDRWTDDSAPRRSKDALPGPDDPIWVCDTFGELGLIYRLAQAALIGGTFDTVEGHNPWEAAMLDTAILHGPKTGNFASDFARLAGAEAAIAVTTADDVAEALRNTALPALAQRAAACAASAKAATDELAQDLLGLLKT